MELQFEKIERSRMESSACVSAIRLWRFSFWACPLFSQVLEFTMDKKTGRWHRREERSVLRQGTGNRYLCVYRICYLHYLSDATGSR